MSVAIVVENVRRIERASFELESGSRTVLVGRNNSGKTTLLDMTARALWSLPGPGVEDVWRQFNTSWYRRVGDTHLQPKITLRIPINTLQADLALQANAMLVVEERGDIIASRVRVDAHEATRLVTTKCEVVAPGGTQLLAQIDEPLTGRLWDRQPMRICASLLDEGAWMPFDTTTNCVLGPNHRPQQLHEANTRFSRAVETFVKRVLYVPAGRQARFGPDAAFQELSQSDTENVTRLLLRLQAVNLPAFEGLSVSLAQLFPEVRRLMFAEVGAALVPQAEFIDGRAEHVGNLGFGFQNALHLLTIVSMAPRDGFLIVDEPEKGLNQSCERDLAVVLEALRPDLTILVATQSEAFCRGLSASSSVVLVEANGNTAQATKLDIINNTADVRHLARAMGLDPLYLGEGGRIIYVEGVSDQIVVDKWFKLHFQHVSGVQVVALGGCGKISEEFVKPLLAAFREHVFLLLDSDRSSRAEERSATIDRLVRWLCDNHVEHYVLRKREVENYLGADDIATAAELHPSVLRAPPGHEDWYDIKAAFARHKGFRYDERRLSVGAYEAKDQAGKKALFQDENDVIVEKLRAFIQM